MRARTATTAGATFFLVAALGAPAWADPAFQVGASGKTFASSAVECVTDPATGEVAPMVEAGLLDPSPNQRGVVILNGAERTLVTAADPSTVLWLGDGYSSVVVALSRRVADTYAFEVPPGYCALPDTSGNTFSADGTLEYAASGKSYATVTPGCAWNPTTGVAQPFVNLFDSGAYLLNVSVNGIPLTQLSASHPSTPVLLGPGTNVITAENGSASTDYYVRDGGDGACALP